jgi:hypothetical protein
MTVNDLLTGLLALVWLGLWAVLLTRWEDA